MFVKITALEAEGASVAMEGRTQAAAEHRSRSEMGGSDSRKMVVSFGEQSNSARPVFGWEIPPGVRLNDEEAYVQRASQTSLAALVSLPAWWEDVRVRIDTSWVSESNNSQLGVGPENSRGITIELPVNFETVDAILFDQVDRSPSIYEWAIRNLTVTPCKEANIVIPGRRLWRSTVVTLDDQKADRIYVLPDMNGIVRPLQNRSAHPATASAIPGMS
jgi:hypothetical protein